MKTVFFTLTLTKKTNSWLSLNRLQLPLGETSYDSIRKISYADGKVKVKNIKRGMLLKDVTKIRNITKDIVSSYGQDPKSNFLRDASMDSIRNSDKIVNNKTQEKFSDRDQNVQEANRILQKQNDELKDLVSEVREIVRLQGRTTNGTVYTRGSIEAAGRKLMRMAGAKGDVTELSGILSECYSSMAEGSEDMVSNAQSFLGLFQ